MMRAAVILVAALMLAGCGAPPADKGGGGGEKPRQEEARKDGKPVEKGGEPKAKELPTKDELKRQIISMTPDEVIGLVGRPTQITPNGAVGCDVWRYERQIASDHKAGREGKFNAWVYFQRSNGRVLKIEL